MVWYGFRARAKTELYHLYILLVVPARVRTVTTLLRALLAFINLHLSAHHRLGTSHLLGSLLAGLLCLQLLGGSSLSLLAFLNLPIRAFNSTLDYL